MSQTIEELKSGYPSNALTIENLSVIRKISEADDRT